MKRLIPLLIVMLLGLVGCNLIPSNLSATTTGETIEGQRALVTYVIDGDTIDVLIDGEEYRVRYIGINTPEREEACYQDATNANAAFVRGQTVTLVRDVSETDRYGRLLRYVYVGNTFVNAELIRQGYAEKVEYPPDTANAAWFGQMAREARSAGLGCWPTGVFD